MAYVLAGKALRFSEPLRGRWRGATERTRASRAGPPKRLATQVRAAEHQEITGEQAGGCRSVLRSRAIELQETFVTMGHRFAIEHNLPFESAPWRGLP